MGCFVCFSHLLYISVQRCPENQTTYIHHTAAHLDRTYPYRKQSDISSTHRRNGLSNTRQKKRFRYNDNPLLVDYHWVYDNVTYVLLSGAQDNHWDTWFPFSAMGMFEDFIWTSSYGDNHHQIGSRTTIRIIIYIRITVLTRIS